MRMRILVCGDRNWSNYTRLATILDDIDAKATIDLIIEGEAKGADTMARGWSGHQS
jgi:YspA, cpYpsA-related SLOG family